MKRFKKTMRLFGLIVLIILACFGIGLGGTPPVLPVIRTKHATEFIETREEDNVEEDMQNLE
nr:hypothetical protein [uncultured Pedobacter sp.]